jgi:hypothetical protein
METFDITRDLEPGITLLEASAGTGKTWTIAALVTKYVAAGESGASVSTASGSMTARGSPTTWRASSSAWARVHGGTSSPPKRAR